MIIGVVGKPNVGKSTFFKALTLAEVLIANYPFATIKANAGFGHVKIDCADTDFNTQCNPRTGYCTGHKRFVPVEVIDVAGLVPGAHEGKGLGNQFLNDLNQANALIHVVDVSGSTNEKGDIVSPGSYDPAEDIKFLEHELDMWYLGILKKGWEKFSRSLVQEKADVVKALAKQLSGLGVTEEMADDVIKSHGLDPAAPDMWDEASLMVIAASLRKLTKPMLIACNKIDVHGASDNFTRLESRFPEHMMVACSSEAELALKEAAKHGIIHYVPGESSFEVLHPEKLNEKQRNALSFINDGILKRFGSTGVQQAINSAVFELLKYMAIFPGGVKKLEDSEGRRLPDCFLMPPNTTALDFAYKLHSDFGKHFIRAIDVKTRMAVGKEHLLKHRDVIEIVSGK
jgi:ribosome-binding ATPase